MTVELVAYIMFALLITTVAVITWIMLGRITHHPKRRNDRSTR